MSTVTLYGRPGCHLCEDARAALERLRRREPFALEDVDIETDPALHARYLERIPVIAVDGEELSDYFVDEDALLARLRREGGSARRASIVSPR
jgi:glutaredoxin